MWNAAAQPFPQRGRGDGGCPARLVRIPTKKGKPWLAQPFQSDSMWMAGIFQEVFRCHLPLVVTDEKDGSRCSWQTTLPVSTAPLVPQQDEAHIPSQSIVLAHGIGDDHSRRKKSRDFWSTRFPEALVTSFPFVERDTITFGSLGFVGRAQALLEKVIEADRDAGVVRFNLGIDRGSRQSVPGQSTDKDAVGLGLVRQAASAQLLHISR